MLFFGLEYNLCIINTLNNLSNVAIPKHQSLSNLLIATACTNLVNTCVLVQQFFHRLPEQKNTVKIKLGKYNYCFTQYEAQHAEIVLTARLIYSDIHIYSTSFALFFNLHAPVVHFILNNNLLFLTSHFINRVCTIYIESFSIYNSSIYVLCKLPLLFLKLNFHH